MKRLTTDKPVKEMWGYELAHNCCYAKDGLARYRDFDTDIDAREFARNLMKSYGLWKAGDDKELVDDELFDEVMLENLMNGPDRLSGLIALFYCGIWAQADLYERLKIYEQEGNN